MAAVNLERRLAETTREPGEGVQGRPAESRAHVSQPDEPTAPHPVWKRLDLRNIGRAVRPFLPDLLDLHVYGGGFLVSVGVGLAWPPGGFIAFGVLLLGLGIWMKRRRLHSRGDRTSVDGTRGNA